MLMATTTKRALTMSIIVRTIVPAAVELAAEMGRTKPIPANPVRVGDIMTAWNQMVNARVTAIATAYASSHHHDGISNGTA
jgi:aspartate ammonia-lyase